MTARAGGYDLFYRPAVFLGRLPPAPCLCGTHPLTGAVLQVIGFWPVPTSHCLWSLRG